MPELQTSIVDRCCKYCFSINQPKSSLERWILYGARAREKQNEIRVWNDTISGVLLR